MGPNNKVKDKQCEGSTTQQLLADLTEDFEEAITAQICLSNQLLDANIETVEGVKEDILILKAESSTAFENNQLPMELDNEATPTTTTTPATTTTAAAIAPTVLQERKKSSTDDEILAATIESDTQKVAANEKASTVVAAATAADTVTEADEIQSKKEVDESIKKEAAEPSVSTAASTSTKQDGTRPFNETVEELPPVRTDSTMTASEVEDNIEERLSQLDGTPVPQPDSADNTSEDVTEALDTTSVARPSTPLASPTRIEDLQQQLQQTPPATSQSQIAFTPQSSCSSMSIMSSANIHIPKDFIRDPTGELEDQDIEEVLKALKGLDSSAPADTICDLNVLFNEVYTTLNYEEINSQHNSSGCGSKAANPLKEMQTEIEKKQQTMQRKIDFMLRRLRKMQSRYICKHASEEISGLFEWSARTVSKSAKHEDDIASRQQLNTAEQNSHPVTATQLTTMLRKIEMAANAQQLTTAASSTSVSNIGKRKYPKKHSMGTSSSPEASSVGGSDRKGNNVTVVPTFDERVTEEIDHVSGMLQSEMHETQKAIDSDATESSSGGESADEMVTYNNHIQQSLQITKRAAWRYARARASIASRWSWLLSQIADLEIKIRQQSELHQELLRSKCPSVIEKDAPAASSYSMSTTTMTASTGSNSTTSFNGYKAPQSLPTPEAAKNADKSVDEESSCCRTRGILASNFRKRKLFQTAHIHTFSKKAARPSNIKCGCQWPLLPCTLCTGRVDPTSPRDLPDTMMMADRVALLDPGYHPVLSFLEDVSTSIHFEAICRLPDWQQRVLRCPVKNIAKSVLRAEREALVASGGRKNLDTVKRKYVKRKALLREQQQQQQPQQQANNGNGTGTLSMSSTPLVANKMTSSSLEMSIKTSPSARINNHYNHNNNNNNHHHQAATDYRLQNYAQYSLSPAHSSSISSTTKNSKNRKVSSSVTAFNSTSPYTNNHPLNDYNNYSSSELNLHDSCDRSRTSSPTHSGSKKNKALDRRNRNSYDIDNIVIPYSVAASTRVELLPYKEIPTPKWRVIDEDSNELAPLFDTQSSCAENNNADTKENMSPRRDCNYQNETSDGNTNTSVISAEPKKSEKKQASPANNNVDFKSDTTESSTEALAESYSNSNTCRLTTKSTVDPTDAFQTLKDNNATQSQHSSVVTTADNSSALNANKIKSDDDQNKQQAEAKVDNVGRKIEGSKTFSEDIVDEDITDEAMYLRHEKALIEERQRLKYPWSTRSRANRRIDSRVDWSSGANTPDPSSPATNAPSVGGGDLEQSIPSPAAPSTPLNLLDSTVEGADSAGALSSVFLNNGSIAPPPRYWPNNINKRNERRRTTSAKNKEQERRSTSPDQKDYIAPYEPRKFPMPDEAYENILKIDNIVNTISSSKTQSGEYSYRNDVTTARGINHKNNAVSKRNDQRSEFGSDYDDAEAMDLNDGADSCYLVPNHYAAEEDDYYDSFQENPFRKRKRNPLLEDGIGDSDVDSLEAGAFSDDDDPNDPEWKGETEDREKIRRRL